MFQCIRGRKFAKFEKEEPVRKWKYYLRSFAFERYPSEDNSVINKEGRLSDFFQVGVFQN